MSDEEGVTIMGGKVKIPNTLGRLFKNAELNTCDVHMANIWRVLLVSGAERSQVDCYITGRSTGSTYRFVSLCRRTDLWLVNNHYFTLWIHMMTNTKVGNKPLDYPPASLIALRINVVQIDSRW